MREKIKNTMKVTCEGVDLTTLSNIEFYVRQGNFFACYIPHVVSASEMVVEIPFEDAKKLKPDEAKLQFAFTDENGTPDASDVVAVEVDDLLKEVGYDPIQSKK